MEVTCDAATAWTILATLAVVSVALVGAVAFAWFGAVKPLMKDLGMWSGD